MTIRLFEENKARTLTFDFSENVSTFSVEIQPGVVYRYDDQVNITQIHVRNAEIIDRILPQLEELLKESGIAIIRKVA